MTFRVRERMGIASEEWSRLTREQQNALLGYEYLRQAEEAMSGCPLLGSGKGKKG